VIVTATRPVVTVRTARPTLEVERLHDIRELEQLRTPWARLWEATDGANPFLHPAWLLPWAKRFVPDGRLDVVIVRRDGELDGVIPLWHWTRRYGPVRLRTVQALGTGPHCSLTEMPGVLAAPGSERTVLRNAMGAIATGTGSWDWIELSLGQDQGWFEPEWMAGPGHTAGAVLHKAARPFVLLDVRDGFAPAKRNLRESLRRSRNRLKRSGMPWEIEVATDGQALRDAVWTIIDLHGKRAAMHGRLTHPDYFADRADADFALEAICAMAAAGMVETRVLVHAGRPVAGVVALHGNGCTFVSFSGMDPQAWEYSPTTLLVADVVQGAVDRGDHTVNLSSGASVAKLRWSERLQVRHDFVVPSPAPRSRLKLAAFWAARSAYSVRREHQRFDSAS